MRIEDKACLAKGFVNPSFIDISTGRKIGFSERHNKLSYMSAEAMAAAFGGDPSYIPAKIGFIYGNEFTESPISRSQSWDMLLQELYSGDSNPTVDVQVVGFSFPPSLGAEKPAPAPSGSSSSLSSGSSSSSSSSSEDQDDGPGDYSRNAVTFHAVSNSQDRGAAFGRIPFSSGDRIYQAVLLGSHQGKLYILSRVSLKENGGYLQKPSGFEVALDWTIVFH